MTYQQSFPRIDKWEVMTSAMDIHWSIQKRWVKTLGNVVWLQTSEGTCICGRGNNVNAHWCRQIVTPRWMWPLTKLLAWLARPNKGGSEMGKYPHVKRNDNPCLPPWCRILPPTKEGPSPPIEEWLHTLHWRQWKTNISQETGIDSQNMRMCLSKKRGKTVE